jgi:hypothetical protein
MYCRHCGTHIADDSSYCAICGGKVSPVENCKKTIRENINLSHKEFNDNIESNNENQVQPIRKNRLVSDRKGDVSQTKISLRSEDTRDQPELYSRKVIFFFTFFLSTLMGGILFAFNLYTLKKIRTMFLVLFFSITYFGLQKYLIYTISTNIALSTLLSHFLGAMFYYAIFWRKFIGVTTAYKSKSYLVPLIVGVIVYYISYLSNY